MMARLDLSPAVRGYLERHAVDPGLAYELGVRARGDAIVYPVDPPLGEPYVRVRDLSDEKKRTMQPKDTPLTLWWPAGRPDPGAEVLLCEGEPDALAALSALNGRPTAVAGLPGTEIPADRVTAELATAASVVLAMDGDDAGKQAANKIAKALQTYTEIRVLRVGDGEDLASRLYREPDREAWLSIALDEAKPAPKVRLKAESTEPSRPTRAHQPSGGSVVGDLGIGRARRR
ncbi:MAG TPA: toprim domain-containing protein [Solirubrobacterales bacterium]|nr:toprim domain-containing protein [Solirubrobacterales bacterium]